jgi:hypothetical protein
LHFHLKTVKNPEKAAMRLKYFKPIEVLHGSVLNTFKSYLQDATKVIGVKQKMRADFGFLA